MRVEDMMPVNNVFAPETYWVWERAWWANVGYAPKKDEIKLTTPTENKTLSPNS